jgi:hypothetical protein
MNAFYISKVDKLRKKTEGTPPPPPPLSWLPRPAFISAGRIKKVVLGLNPTEALGIDGIPVSVLKTGIQILADPIAYMINRSLATGVVPAGLKRGIVHPVHKGGGGARGTWTQPHKDQFPSSRTSQKCWKWSSSRTMCGTT